MQRWKEVLRMRCLGKYPRQIKMFGQTTGRPSLSGNTSLNSSIASPRRSLQPTSKSTPNVAARSVVRMCIN